MSRFRGKGSSQSNESNAEVELLKMLHRGYDQRMDLKEKPFTQITLPLKITRPDFYFPGRKIAVYLDGSVHTHDKIAERDEEIDNLLKAQGIRVLRFPYRRATKAWLMEVYQEIRHAVNGLEEGSR